MNLCKIGSIHVLILFSEKQMMNDLNNEPNIEKQSRSNKKTKKRRQNPINDLDLENWKSLTEIWTDSLWLIPSRDRSGAHSAEYHGNFVPQIPRQVIQRYTKKGDVVLDAFLGSGTTLIESQRLGRHGIGIELLPEVAEKANARIKSEPNTHGVQNYIIIGDSASADITHKISDALKHIGKDAVDLVVLHPPYHDIINFPIILTIYLTSKPLKPFARVSDKLLNTQPKPFAPSGF